MSYSEEKSYLQRKGVLPQREHVTTSTKKSKTVLLEYFVNEHEVGWLNKAGWRKYGKYASVGQAMRVLESARTKRNIYYGPPKDCKWRIDGVEVEGS